MEFFYNNWEFVAGIVFSILSFFIPGVRAVMSVVLRTALSKSVLERLAVEILDHLAKKTKSKVDDTIVAALKAKLGID